MCETMYRTLRMQILLTMILILITITVTLSWRLMIRQSASLLPQVCEGEE